MYKDALMLVAKLVLKTHIKYPIIFSAAILAATYAFLYKTGPRAPPSTPSIDIAEMETDADESGHSLLDCESLASEPSAKSKGETPSETDSTDSWIDDSRENDIEVARHFYNIA